MAKQQFEKKLERLEELVKKLSEEKVSLDEAMKLYQEGMKLGAECFKKVRGVEKDVQQLVEKSEGLGLKKFEEK